MFEIWGGNPHDALLGRPYARAHSPGRSVVRHRGYEMNKALPSAMALVVLLLAGVPPAEAEPALTCRQGDRGRLIRYEKVASYPTAAAVQAYFDEWIAFYQDFYHFPTDIPVTFEYGFESYKAT
jgi:hypothetical protein